MRLNIFFGLALGVAGCGGFGSVNDTLVSGKILGPDGKPLGGGQVTLYSTLDKTKASGATIRPDGTFTISSAPTGDCLATVETESIRAVAQNRGPKPPKDTPIIPSVGSMNTVYHYTKIDGRYAKAETSGLKVTVKPGKTEWDIQLK